MSDQVFDGVRTTKDRYVKTPVVTSERHDLETLTEELADTQQRMRMEPGGEFLTRLDADDSPIYVVRTANGHHESRDSHAHALFLLVHAHRTRLEDLEVTHRRILAKTPNVTFQEARNIALAIGQAIRDEDPERSVEDHDALVEAAIRSREREQDAVAAQAAAAEAEALRIGAEIRARDAAAAEAENAG